MTRMSRIVAIIAVFIATAMSFAQNATQDPSDPAVAAPYAAQPAIAPAPAAAAPAAARPAAIPAANADALLLYRQGRDLETAGRKPEAAEKYRAAIAVCDREIATDATRMDSYAVKCWCLFRIDRHQEVVNVGNAALSVRFDARVVETMGESYFFLGNLDLALKSLQRYVDNAGEYGDRVPTAYFYMGETYVRIKKYEHADIAYSMAVAREPSMARWWFRYGNVVESLGDKAKAKTLYEKALKLSPGMREASEGVARLQGVQG